MLSAEHYVVISSKDKDPRLIWLCQTANDGLALELTGKGTKHYKEDEINLKNAAKLHKGNRKTQWR